MRSPARVRHLFCGDMATRDELSLHATESPWSRGVTVPAYRRPSADVGTPAYFHDHRYMTTQAGVTGVACKVQGVAYMTTQAGVTWGHGFRKQEQQRGVLSRINREWVLEDWELLVNGDVGRHLPTLMSSRFALAWVAERWSMAIFASNRTTADYNAGWNRLLDGAQSTIANVSSRPEISGAATITAADVVLTVGHDAEIDMSPLAQKWPGMCDDWSELASDPRHHLPPLDVRCVPLMVLYKFVELRRRASAIPPGHPLLALRTATMQVAVFFLEAAVEFDIDEPKPANLRPPPLELIGSKGRTRCHHRPLQKAMSLAAAKALHGSNETIMRARGECAGTASQLRAAKLSLYQAEARTLMASANAWHLTWDGSCHGGKSMLCGAITDPDSNTGALLKPEATW